MGITSNVTPVTYSGASNSATSTDDSLGPDAFLTLLTTEMENQDPDNPQDATESVTQLAQMSELQYQQQLTSDFATFQSNFGVLQSASLIGKGATVNYTDGTGNSDSITGVISSIEVQNGQPFFTMTNASGATIEDSSGNAELFSTADIVGIGSASAITGTASTSSTATAKAIPKV